jgi:DNA-binding MarR family transcriptional regulator
MTKPTVNLDEFYTALINFVLLAKHQVIRAAANHDLTNVQAMLLLMLRNNEPRPMNSFCGALGCDPSNITGIVDGLQKKGLITRSENPQDRRVKVVRIEPQGTAVRNALMADITHDGNDAIVTQLSPEEFTTFATLMQKVAAQCPAAAFAKARKA